MEPMHAFGNFAYYLLSGAIAIWGMFLASDRAQLRSAPSLQFATRRRSRMTGGLVVIAQVASMLLMASGHNPFSQGATVIGSTVIAYVLGWAIEKFSAHTESEVQTQEGN